jgi:hypothetical protein
MRGPTPQLLAGADEISTRQLGDTPKSDAPKLGQELLHNVHMIVNLAEAELHSVRRRAAAESERAAALERDAAAARQRVEAGAQRLKRLEQVTYLNFVLIGCDSLLFLQ